MSPKDTNGMANNVDPDEEQSDLGLHCLPRHICPKTYDHHSNQLNCFSVVRSIFSKECNII